MFLKVRSRVALFSILLLGSYSFHCFGWSLQPFKNHPHLHDVEESVDSTDRRRLLCSLIQSTGSLSLLLSAATPPTLASNLPESNDADTRKVGTVEALIPIVALRASLARLDSALSKSNGSTNLELEQTIPKGEKEFKRLFDSYSDPVSYKQKFMDQNAFLVYYTKGFDGPGRANMEADINERQTVQFGLRNEAWIAWENFLSELKFLSENDNDCALYLSSTLRAVDSYLALVPLEDVRAAKEKMGTL